MKRQDSHDLLHRGSGPEGATADTIICEDGDEVRADRNDTVVNPAECGSIERSGSGSGGTG
jgi:hypothetical protein